MTVRTTLALALTLLCTVLATGGPAELKIGYVDLQRALNEMRRRARRPRSTSRSRSTACRST